MNNNVMEHPLQDINLNHDDHDEHHDYDGDGSFVSSTAKNVETLKNPKKNWVKFDDDDDDHDDNDDHNKYNVNANVGSLSDENKLTVNNNNNNNNNDQNANTNRLTSRSPVLANRLRPQSAAAAPIASKRHSPAGAAASEQFIHSQQRVTNAIANTSQNNQQSTITAATTATAIATTPAPVTATRISKLTDTAPAVLATESIHVNLNASNKTQQHKPNTSTTTIATATAASTAAATATALATSHTNKSSSLKQLPQYNNNTNNINSNNSNNSNNNIHHQLNHHVIGKATMSTGINAEAQQKPLPSAASSPPPQMRTIELSTGRIREGFANGDVIVTLLPANTKWPWITPAVFRPELVPEELMAQGLTLTVEEYVHAMETLVNDYRFTLYNICYKRILVCWIFFAFAVLLTLLFSGLQGVPLFSLGVGWLFLNAAAIFVCMWIKLRLSRGLEKCLARVNKQLIKHKILLILDDRGRISCHKVNLCFLYFDSMPCVNFLNEFLEQTEQNGGEKIQAGWEAKLDIDVNDIVIQGTNPVRLSRKQERGIKLFLRYASRWGMEALRGILDVTGLDPGRHCKKFQCPCQYIKDHIQCKPRDYPCNCIAYASDPQLQYRY